MVSGKPRPLRKRIARTVLRSGRDAHRALFGSGARAARRSQEIAVSHQPRRALLQGQAALQPASVGDPVARRHQDGAGCVLRLYRARPLLCRRRLVAAGAGAAAGDATGDRDPACRIPRLDCGTEEEPPRTRHGRLHEAHAARVRACHRGRSCGCHPQPAFRRPPRNRSGWQSTDRHWSTSLSISPCGQSRCSTGAGRSRARPRRSRVRTVATGDHFR